MVEEAYGYVQGESLKPYAALLVRLLNSPITRSEEIAIAQKSVNLIWVGVLLTAIVAFRAQAADAACECRCVNGNMQALCTSAIDIRPICGPTVCQIVPPSIAPIQSPTIPPIGTSSCSQAQVLDPYTHQYVWQQVCR